MFNQPIYNHIQTRYHAVLTLPCPRSRQPCLIFFCTLPYRPPYCPRKYFWDKNGKDFQGRQFGSDLFCKGSFGDFGGIVSEREVHRVLIRKSVEPPLGRRAAACAAKTFYLHSPRHCVCRGSPIPREARRSQNWHSSAFSEQKGLYIGHRASRIRICATSEPH